MARFLVQTHSTKFSTWVRYGRTVPSLNLFVLSFLIRCVCLRVPECTTTAVVQLLNLVQLILNLDILLTTAVVAGRDLTCFGTGTQLQIQLYVDLSGYVL